jgi:hypothetical protein
MLELTREQEDALIAVIDRELAAPQIEADLATAQEELDLKLVELQAERDVIQLRTNVELNALEADYRATLDAKKATLEDVKARRTTDVRA